MCGELDGSGERVLARWPERRRRHGLAVRLAGTGPLWQLKTDGSAVRTVAADGQMTETAVQWPEELAGCWMPACRRGCWTAGLLVQVDGPAGRQQPPGGGKPRRRQRRGDPPVQLTDLHGDPRYGAQYAMEPMKLYGAGSGQVLLACAMRDTSRPAMAEDGSLYETLGTRDTVRPAFHGGLFRLAPELDPGGRRLPDRFWLGLAAGVSPGGRPRPAPAPAQKRNKCR